jgi:hypothetical protein
MEAVCSSKTLVITRNTTLRHKSKDHNLLKQIIVGLNYVIPYIITLMMEAAGTSETSVNFYQTKWRNSEEYSNLYTLISFPNFITGKREVPITGVKN